MEVQYHSAKPSPLLQVFHLMGMYILLYPDEGEGKLRGACLARQESLLNFLCACVYPRHRFFPEVEELRAQEHQRNEEKRQEVLRRRQEQLAEIAQKRSVS